MDKRIYQCITLHIYPGQSFSKVVTKGRGTEIPPATTLLHEVLVTCLNAIWCAHISQHLNFAILPKFDIKKYWYSISVALFIVQ